MHQKQLCDTILRKFIFKLDHMPSFPSSRETISQSGIKLPTTPFGLGTSPLFSDVVHHVVDVKSSVSFGYTLLYVLKFIELINPTKICHKRIELHSLIHIRSQ